MRTASKLLIMFCLMSKKAKGSLKYSSLEEALHGIRATVLGSEDFSHSEKLLKSGEFSYYEKSDSEEPSNSKEFLYYEKSNSDEASNSSEEVYQDIQTSGSKNATSGDTYRAGFGPSNRKEKVKATSKVPALTQFLCLFEPYSSMYGKVH